jgi:site-specific DNA-methyltransferase (adenine-specific)
MPNCYQNVNTDNFFSQKIADIKSQIEEIDKQIEQIKQYGSLLPINQVLLGDCYEVLKTLPDNFIDCVVTDPPYSLGKVKDITKLITAWMFGEDGTEHHSNGFMGKNWDIMPSPKIWREVYRVLKPGGYALVFAGTRTIDLMGLSLRLAGFEISESISWLFGSGFPKSKKMLKPAHEPILFCYKPGKRENINIDDCRSMVSVEDQHLRWNNTNHKGCDGIYQWGLGNPITYPHTATAQGRYPANVILSHTPDCVKCGTKLITAYQCIESCPVRLLDEQTAEMRAGKSRGGSTVHVTPSSDKNLFQLGTKTDFHVDAMHLNDGDGTANASRFFLNLSPEVPFIYHPKASQSDRTCNGKVENTHITVKPTNLISYLVRLVCPENGIVLDPFVGSGTTALACIREKKNYIGIEREEEYYKLALARIGAIKPVVQ